MRQKRYLVLAIGDLYSKEERIPLEFMTMNTVRSTGQFKLKATIVKNIVNNRGQERARTPLAISGFKRRLFLSLSMSIFVFQGSNFLYAYAFSCNSSSAYLTNALVVISINSTSVLPIFIASMGYFWDFLMSSK